MWAAGPNSVALGRFRRDGCGPGNGLDRIVWLAGFVASVAAAPVSADIYVAYDAAGTPHFASHPSDPSYSVFLRDSPGVGHAGRLAPQGASLRPLIERSAHRHAVPAQLVSAVLHVESNFNPLAVSHRGAKGAMQLTSDTATRYGVANPFDAAQNIDAGVRYLGDLMRKYNGSLALALSAYNAGEGAVARHGARIPPFRETMLYVPAVLARMKDLEGKRP